MGPNASQILLKLRVLGCEAFELGDNPPRDRGSNLSDLRVVLQQLARDIQGQVLAVDHAIEKPQIGGEEFGVIGNEDPPDVQLDPPFAGGIEQVEGRVDGAYNSTA